MAVIRTVRRHWAVPARLAAAATLAAACGTQLPHPPAPAGTPGVPAAATVALPPMSAAQLAGQRVIYSYTGLTPPARLLSLISHGEAGGVIFFAGNIGTPAQFASAIGQLNRAAASKLDPVHLPLLLMTDQEGGVVRRLPGPPDLSARQMGEAADPVAVASQEGGDAAANLRVHGLNVNLAPVLDVYRQAGNFIDQYGRSFSVDPGKVAKLGAAYAAAEQRARVAATGKHFPGLGAAGPGQDTDLRPVTLPLSASALRGVDELPYRAAIAAHVRLIMVSWVVYQALDPDRPAGLSPAIVGGELRRRLGFTGVTITDALEAGALRSFGSIGNRATLAARAGMDLLLCSQGKVAEGESAMKSLQNAYSHGKLSASTFKAAVEQILALREWLARR